MRLQIGISTILLLITSAVQTLPLRAQLNEPQISGLTRGATHERRTSDVPGLTAVTSACPISDDPSYGATPANPIKVGGGAMYVMARSMRFLQSLRGPAGQGLHLKRLGSFDGPDDTILDVYQVDYDEVVRQLYVDGYRFSAPKAPLGLVCGASMPLDPPGPNPFETRRQLITMAAALDAKAASPISLDPDGSATHGVIFDHVRLIGNAFAVAAAAGHPLEVNNVPSEISRPHFLVVAYPLACNGGSPIPPQSVKVSDANGNSPGVMNEARGEQIRGLVPSVNAPASALAVMYGADLALPGQVEIQYATACGSAPQSVVLPMKGEAGRITHRVAGRVPPGVIVPPGGTAVRVQVYFDFNGMPRFPAYAGGLGALADAAVAAVSEFRADPPRVNGAPLLQVSMIAVAFQP